LHARAANAYCSATYRPGLLAEIVGPPHSFSRKARLATPNRIELLDRRA